jgi:maltooligosyltrehalose trehalohydrolase
VSLQVGAVPVGAAGTRFTVWAPAAATVSVHLPASGERVRLQAVGGGYHTALVPCGPGTRYRYVLDDGASELADPASRYQPEGVQGPSEVVDLGEHRWSDQGYHPAPWRDSVLYELHVGTFTGGGTFASAVAELDDIAELGVTAIEIMPVAQFPGGRNWGYDGVFPFAVQDTYGGPWGLQSLVDECHRRNLAVVDVVYNHLGPEGNVLPAYGPYLTDRYRTPWGQAVNLDGPGSDPVRDYFVANALQWLETFHVDGLRLDAVHELIDRSARPFLVQLSEAVAECSERTGRAHWLIAESADNDPRVVTPVRAGGLGLDAQWNDDFHHAVHAAITGESTGYYADYSGADDVARAMDQGFVYQGQYSSFRQRRHGAPATAIQPGQLVIFDQNHDQVGNRPDGARLTALVPPERLRLAAALLLLSPGVPLLFMGEEYAETAPFPYFVSHYDPALLQAVQRGRAAEYAQLEGDPIDPADPETFARAMLNRARRHEEPHRGQFQLCRSLLSLRAAEPALRRSSRECARAHADGTVVTLLLGHDGVDVAVFYNLSPSAAEAHLPEGACWTEVLAGSGHPPSGRIAALDGWGFRLFRRPAPREEPVT